MLKAGTLALASLAIVVSSPAQAATQIFFSSTNTAVPSYINQSGAFVQTFGTSGANNQAYNPTVDEAISGTVRSFNSNSSSFKPTGASGNYLGIYSSERAIGTYTITFPGQSVISFLVGGISTASFVTLNFADLSSETRNGGAIFGGAVTAVDSGRVTYDFGSSPKLTSIVFGSNSRTAILGIDYIVAAVPEPATWLMMILGFGVVGGALRRRRNQGQLAAA